MTLLFLGETAKSCLPQVLQAAAEIHVPAFKMELSHFSCWQHNAIGYVAPENCPAELNELARQLRASVAGAGIGFDRKAFNPHVTLLRKMPQWRPSQPVAPLDWEVRDFALVQSVPESCGAHYAILARWPLGSIRA